MPQFGARSTCYDDLLNFSTPEPLTDGAWHLITVTYDGTNVTAYEDGRSLGTKQFANALSTSAADPGAWAPMTASAATAGRSAACRTRPSIPRR